MVHIPLIERDQSFKAEAVINGRTSLSSLEEMGSGRFITLPSSLFLLIYTGRYFAFEAVVELDKLLNNEI